MSVLSNTNLEGVLKVLVVVVVLAVLCYLVYYFTVGSESALPVPPTTTNTVASMMDLAPMMSQSPGAEGFDTMPPVTREGFDVTTTTAAAGPSPAENGQQSESKPLAGDNTLGMNQLPSECYPKDVLSSVDLLPSDANSYYANVNPNGQGALSDQNFLTAGYHIGINTVGQTLRNANRQLRSDPPCPQVPVSPWNNTTIEYDGNRRPLEIGGSA